MNIITCFEVVGRLKCSLTSATKHQVFLCAALIAVRLLATNVVQCVFFRVGKSTYVTSSEMKDVKNGRRGYYCF